MIKKWLEFVDFEKQNLILKMLFNNRLIKLNKIGMLHRRRKYGSLSILKNVCIYSKRSRGILCKYKISRLELKRLYKSIGGLRKSSF